MAGLALAGMVIGTGLKAFGAIEQGQSAEAAANYNAQIAEQQAKMQAAAAKSKTLDLSMQRRQTIGRQVAAAGASGVDPNTGSPLDVMAETAAHYENDIYTAGIGAQQALVSGQEQANIDIWQGQQSAMAGWITGGADLFSGGASAYYMNSKFGGK